MLDYTTSHGYCVKRMLTSAILRNPTEAFETFGNVPGANLLRRMWDLIADDFLTTEYPFKDLALWHRPAGEGCREAVVIVLPKPQNRGEAWYIGIFRTPDNSHRVFALERGADPLTGEPIAMLAETDTEGRANWGPVDQHWLEVFVERVDQILNDPEAAPLTYTPMASVA